MYNHKYGLTFGFHGCDKKVRDAVVNGGSLSPSTNDYDWLGHGIYFWEDDPRRALEWAIDLSKRKGSFVQDPAVVGAVINLGNCLDLTTRDSIEVLQFGYNMIRRQYEKNELPLPKNKNIGANTDWLLRELDCTVIQSIHKATTKPNSPFNAFDSVRGIFFEGSPAYEGAGFREKTHTQLCIVNPNCIMAYFVPRELDPNYPEV